MKAEVPCDVCRTKVPIEDAYRMRVRGFYCQGCYNERQKVQWVVVVGAAVLVLLFAISKSMTPVQGDEPRTSVGIGITEGRGDLPDRRSSISLRVAPGSLGGSGSYELGWRDQIPRQLISYLRYSASRADNVAFDCDEVLGFPGRVVESSNESVVVHLRSPDGGREFELVAESDDLAALRRVW